MMIFSSSAKNASNVLRPFKSSFCFGTCHLKKRRFLCIVFFIEILMLKEMSRRLRQSFVDGKEVSCMVKGTINSYGNDSWILIVIGNCNWLIISCRAQGPGR